MLDSIIRKRETSGPLENISSLKDLKFFNEKLQTNITNDILKSRFSPEFKQQPRYTLDETVISPRYIADEVC